MMELRDVWAGYKVHGHEHMVLRGVNATFWRGDAVGILGRNGAGKSTLIKVLGGRLQPKSGSFRHDPDFRISWPLGFSGAIHGSITGADNARFVARIYGRDPYEMEQEVEAFAELGTHMYKPVNTYSSGMRGRLAFAMSMAIDFDCYLVDEAIAAGDARFQSRFRSAMEERRNRSTMILVTHSAGILRDLCTSAAILQQGKLAFYEDLDEAISIYERL